MCNVYIPLRTHCLTVETQAHQCLNVKALLFPLWISSNNIHTNKSMQRIESQETQLNNACAVTFGSE